VQPVLGVLHRAEHPVAVGVQLAPVVVDQLLERRRVTPAGRCQQFRLREHVHVIRRDHHHGGVRNPHPTASQPVIRNESM
jgi:hypothetical protein